MAQRSYFFDSVDHDRIYTSADFARVFGAIAGRDGVIYGYGDDLKVTPGTGMNVTVGTGAAFVQGRMLEVYDQAETLPIATADATNPRIDRVVIRVDLSTAQRKAYLAVKTGTAAATPVAPLLQQDSTIWETSLAQVRVPAGATGIVVGDIADEREFTSLSDGATAATTLYTPGVAGFDVATVQAGLDELAGSRITEMGTNNFGSYTKWDNGLAYARGYKALEGVVTGSAEGNFSVTLPITLLGGSAPYFTIIVQYASLAWGRRSLPAIRNVQRIHTGESFYVYTETNDFTFPSNAYLCYVALGRWK